MLDIENIAIELGYSMLMGFWIKAGDGTAGVGDGPDEDRNGTSRISIDGEENNELVEIDYEQKEEDIAVETCVDLTRELDSLQILDIPREECGSGSEIDCGFDDLRSLDESNCEEELLSKDLEINNSHAIVWITDKQKWLINSITEMFPNSEHRFGVKHLYNNFKSEHNGLLFRKILCSAVKSTTEQGFAHSMKRMRSESVAKYEWLANKDLHHSSIAYFKDITVCDMLYNNMCETFKKAILQAYDKPVITLMKMIRNYLMKRLVRKIVELEKWKHDIGPNVFRVVEKLKMESSICHPEYSGNFKYQVRGVLEMSSMWLT
ncbi:hypothetical protein Q3G72_030559 [Acer saccharum]|nr:hypothetical protein Q3G72_030559 [Acer saccharum]